MRRLRRSRSMPGAVSVAMPRAAVAMAALLFSGGVSAAGPSRTILQQADLPPASSQSATLGTVVLNPGDALPWHTHRGIEIGYVIAGDVILSVEGMADQTFHAGQSFIIPRGLVHRSRQTGTAETRMVLTWVTDTGTALSTPAAPPAP